MVNPQSQNNQSCLISRDIASRILCLPIYPGLTAQDQHLVITKIAEALNG